MFRSVLSGIRDRVEGTLAISLMGLDGIAIESLSTEELQLEAIGHVLRRVPGDADRVGGDPAGLRREGRRRGGLSRDLDLQGGIRTGTGGVGDPHDEGVQPAHEPMHVLRVHAVVVLQHLWEIDLPFLPHTAIIDTAGMPVVGRMSPLTALAAMRRVTVGTSLSVQPRRIPMLDFNRGGSAPTAGASGNSRADLPKATSWLNIGYIVTVAAAMIPVASPAMQWIVEPTGMLRSGSTLPGLIGESTPDCSTSPSATPRGAIT